MKKRNKSVPAVYIILKKDSEILLGRRQNTTYYDGWYGVPADHIEAKELPISALIREAKEEVGININPKDVRLIHTLYRTAHDETGDRSDYFFIIEKWRGEPVIMEPEKCDDLKWFSVDQLPENTIHHERYVIESIKQGMNYSEINLENTVKNPTK